MFKVQRFTAEDAEDEGPIHGDDSTSILKKVLEKAKARVSAKRARPGPGTDAIDTEAATSFDALDRKAGADSKRAKADGGVSSFRESSRGAEGVTAADRATAAPVGREGKEEGGDTSDDETGSSSGEAEDSSSEEGDSDVDEEEIDGQEEDGDGSALEEDTEIREGAADGQGGSEGAGGGQGLRPMEEVAEEWGLDARLSETLREEGVKHFFPIQVRVVPDIVATERHSHVQSRDICVSAPTGSGKTLVFVLGVLQALIRRRVVRLRALVLLPSRDLAMQVHTVFKRYAEGTGLKVGLAIGQTNFLEEQLALVGAVALAGNPVATARASFLRAQGRHMGPDPTKASTNMGAGAWSGSGTPAGGSSEVDIVVATPGRLLDHLAQTPGFTLQHLRYLVIDEADRLLNQSYQGWVGKVVKAAYRRDPGTAAPVYETNPHPGKIRGNEDEQDGIGARKTPSTNGNNTNGDSRQQSQHRPHQPPHCGGGPRTHPGRFPSLPSAISLDPVTVRGRPLATGDRVRGATVSTPPLRKLLFSATLTNNPQKLAGLDVVNPLIYTAREMTATTTDNRQGLVVASQGRGRLDGGGDAVVKRPSQETRRSNLDEISLATGEGEGRFSTPATLAETYTVCDSQAKPLVLLSLLREMVGRQTELSVVFTSSVDSTHRLFRLLQLFGGFEGAPSSSTHEGGTITTTPNDDDGSEGGGVAEFSSSLGQRQRSHIIRRARAGAVRVIVCSDGMARGMDLDSVGLVVNYDVPSQPKTYVHRVGRTARAGSRGTAVTIAKKGQVKQFLKMRSSVDGKRVRLDSSPADQSRLIQLAGRYQRCLRDLKEVLEAERAGELDPSAPVLATEMY
ncbi:unnamed protein product [Scytosiphon promiscuus]